MISKSHFVLVSFLILLFACEEQIEEKIAFGGKKYGGVFTFYSPEKTSVFFPLFSPSVYNQRILSQLFEPLFILDNEGNIKPNLAKKFRVCENGKVLYITLRNDVYFHEDNCFSAAEKMTADDVKFTLDYACSGLKWNSLASLFREKIQNGKSFYKNSSEHIPSGGIQGIQVINDTTLKITLTDNYSNFQKILAHQSIGIFSKKAYEYYKNKFIYHPIGTGPFALKSYINNKITLKRNPNYWKYDKYGNHLPFLKEIQIKTSKGIKSEYLSFSKKNADIIFELPVDQLDLLFGSLNDAQKGKNLLHRVIVKKGTKINYLSFDCESKPFKDTRVRKAFCLSINRKRICDEAMNGEGNFTLNGFIPKNTYYKPNTTDLLKFDPLEAKKLLKEAGYSIEKPFPKLTMYINSQKGSIADKWSKHIVNQLKKNIGINISLKYCSLEDKHKAILSRKAKIWKSAWIPDYPDAEAYFRVFYGNENQQANEENYYNNFYFPLFDSLYNATQRVRNSEKRNKLNNLLDQILIDQAAMIPIFSEDLFVIVNLRIRDFQINNSGIIDFSKIYIKEVN